MIPKNGNSTTSIGCTSSTKCILNIERYNKYSLINQNRQIIAKDSR